MEIKNSLLKHLDPYRTQLDAKAEAATARAGNGAQAQAQSAPQGDRVSLSPTALLHTTAHAAASAAPEVRQEKVDALKERVSTGAYTVDAKKVAEKLLQDEAFLAGTLGDGE